MNVIDIDENAPHEISELICLKCLCRAIHVYPESTMLKDLECKCGAVGYLIKTGQTLPPENECETCKHYDEYDGKCKLHIHSSDEFYCGYYSKEKQC